MSWDHAHAAALTGETEPVAALAGFEEQSRQLLQQQSLLMAGTLAASIGHEMNNQLTIGYGNLEVALQCMAQQEYGSATERMHCAAQALRDAFELTQALFSGVNPDFHPVPLSLNLVIADFLFVLKSFLRKHKTAVSFSAAENLPLICGVEMQIRQVLFNLLRNALQARPDVSIRIKTGYQEKSQMVVCQLGDNGPGMDRAMLSTLFQPFHSGHASGHGLGLYVCNAIVSRHQGSLTVQSRLGQGTHFTISLPAHRPSQRAQL